MTRLSLAIIVIVALKAFCRIAETVTETKIKIRHRYREALQRHTAITTVVLTQVHKVRNGSGSVRCVSQCPGIIYLLHFRYHLRAKRAFDSPFCALSLALSPTLDWDRLFFVLSVTLFFLSVRYLFNSPFSCVHTGQPNINRINWNRCVLCISLVSGFCCFRFFLVSFFFSSHFLSFSRCVYVCLSVCLPLYIYSFLCIVWCYSYSFIWLSFRIMHSRCRNLTVMNSIATVSFTTRIYSSAFNSIPDRWVRITQSNALLDRTLSVVCVCGSNVQLVPII